MQLADYIVILLYIVGIVAAGAVFAGRMKSSKDMFAAGGKSPWWVSGLSGFMTMFSAGTFVIWGGIAYKYGLVAVVINMCFGVSAILVGYFLAGYWRKLGVQSASEFLQLRFGRSIVQFYTWFQGTIGIFAVGGAIYALSTVVCALVPLPEGHLLADPNTGMLSVSITSLTLCLIVTVIAFSGGLWAVLMTDVLQFVILMVSVVFVVPLMIGEVGGVSVLLKKLPEGHLSPTAMDFTWLFFAGWIVIHFFKIGGEWGYVQRYTCVPSAKDAKKAALIFGAMYLVSPIFWMLPPLVFRAINPNVDTEQAYILSCQLVLPAGMMGLMIASMASATASAATSQLNVFAGAFTTGVYKELINPSPTEKQLVAVGRLFTIVLGCVVASGALLIPRYGYTKFIIDQTTLLTGALVLPTIWGLFSKKIGMKSVWGTTLLGFVCAIIVKFGLINGGFLHSVSGLEGISNWVTDHSRLADFIPGILIPLLLLWIVEMNTKSEHPGWQKVMEVKKAFHETEAVQSSSLPTIMVAITLAAIAVVMGVLAIIDPEARNILFAFSGIMLLLVAGFSWAILKRR